MRMFFNETFPIFHLVNGYWLDSFWFENQSIEYKHICGEVVKVKCNSYVFNYKSILCSQSHNRRDKFDTNLT